MQYCWPLLIVAGFLELVALRMIALAFLPAEDKRPRPPRGFVGVTRVFDGFWDAVRTMTERLFR